jgi:hypothetical protein
MYILCITIYNLISENNDNEKEKDNKGKDDKDDADDDDDNDDDDDDDDDNGARHLVPMAPAIFLAGATALRVIG